MYQVVEEVIRGCFCIGKNNFFFSLKFPLIKLGWKQDSA